MKVGFSPPLSICPSLVLSRHVEIVPLVDASSVSPAQLTSYGMFRDYAMVAVSGPTWDQVPAFQWSTSPYKNLMHMGQPDLWQFKPVTVTWTP